MMAVSIEEGRRRVLFLFLGVVSFAGIYMLVKSTTDTSSSFWKTTVLICERKINTGYSKTRLRMEVRIKQSRIPNPLVPSSIIFLKSLNKNQQNKAAILQKPLNDALEEQILMNEGAIKILRGYAARTGKKFGTKEEALEDFLNNPNRKEKVFFINPWKDDYESFFTRGTLVVELDKYTGRMEFYRGHAECKKKDKLF